MKPDDRVDLPQGDPAWSVLIWRSDSMMLARLRPVLEKIMMMADEPCLRTEPPCPEIYVDDPERWCLSCRLVVVRAQIFRATGLGR